MSSIVIGFDEQFQQTSGIMISIDTPIMEHEHIWVWDHYYSLVLHRLGESTYAEKLQETMSQWAIGFASKMYSPINELHAEGALILDSSINIKNHLENTSEAYFVELTPQSNSWPSIHARIPDDVNEEYLYLSVIAFAQYFLKLNTNFFRELPMHILAMRKYYVDEKNYLDEDSISEAPAFAFNTALKFYQSLEEKENSRQ